MSVPKGRNCRVEIAATFSAAKTVTAVTKANVYFDGKVVSHSILFPDGSKIGRAHV